MSFGLTPVPGDFNPPVPADFDPAATVVPLVVSLVGSVPGDASGTLFDAWTGTVLLTSDDASWTDLAGITFASAGIYEISLQGRGTEASGSFPIAFPPAVTVYGSQVPGAELLDTSRYASNAGGSPTDYASMGVDSMTWHDAFTFVATAGETCRPALYCNQYAFGGVIAYAAMLTVRRLGDAA